VDDASEGDVPTERPTTMRKKYFGFEQAFEYIWNGADGDGIWNGSDSTLSEEFHVPEEESHEMLAELSDRGLIQKLAPAKFIVVRWQERDEPDEEDHN
jgi:hypothetical protein